MIKVILFDVDGVIVRLREKYFSQRLAESSSLNLDESSIKSFFSNEFLLCEIGKGDLKQELHQRIKAWGYLGTVDELIKFWFEGEAELIPQVVEEIKALRSKGVKCFVATNNEKYRTQYLWERVGLINFMDGIFSSAHVGFLKNDINFWEKVYKELSEYGKGEILVLDNEEDIVKAAKSFGFSAELFTGDDNFKQRIGNYIS